MEHCRPASFGRFEFLSAWPGRQLHSICGALCRGQTEAGGGLAPRVLKVMAAHQP